MDILLFLFDVLIQWLMCFIMVICLYGAFCKQLEEERGLQRFMLGLGTFILATFLHQ